MNIASLKPLSAAIVVLCFGGGVLPSIAEEAATGGASLRTELSAEDFQRAGLNKLTAEELAYLETVVRARKGERSNVSADQTRPANPLRGEAAFGRDAEVQAVANVMLEVPDEIRSRIKGRFNGWTGRTSFTLENGQTWRQSEGGEFFISAESPVVVIKRGTLGTYFLRIDGYNTRTKVVRVK